MAEPARTQPRGSRVISRLLPPAIRLWLRTQLDHVEDLVFDIEGGDRDVLSGHISAVILSAQTAIYQGIHLSQIAIKAQDIRMNLGQVMRRQPLRLLASFPVSGRVSLTAQDLTYSLQAPLLEAGLYDFLLRLAQAQPETTDLDLVLKSLSAQTLLTYYRPTADIAVNQITLRLHPQAGQSVPALAIATELTIQDGQRLCLDNLRWVSTPDGAYHPAATLHGFAIDLGPAVSLTDCQIQADQIVLAGTVHVMPNDAQ